MNKKIMWLVGLGVVAYLLLKDKEEDTIVVGDNIPPMPPIPPDTVGCTDPLSVNYNPLATFNDGSCIYLDEPIIDDGWEPVPDDVIEEVIDDEVEDIVEDPVEISGCMDSTASNYDSTATIDDGSCIPVETITPISGCMDSTACNYNETATEDDGSCQFLDVCNVCGGDGTTCQGCTNSIALNYDSTATVDDGSCLIEGCTDSQATNYNSTATTNDGSCQYEGCPCVFPEDGAGFSGSYSNFSSKNQLWF